MVPLNISIFVDVIPLLSGSAAETCVFAFDDSVIAPESRGRGTSALHSPIYPGQYVIWSLIPIDVQTPVWLSEMSFMEPVFPPQQSLPAPMQAASPSTTPEDDRCADNILKPVPGPVWARRWEGYVPWNAIPGAVYPYKFGLQFGGLTGRTVSIEGCSLAFLSVSATPPGAGTVI